MTNQQDLLNELRLDRRAPRPAPARPLWPWLLALVALLLAVAGGWWWLAGDAVVNVRTASASAVPAGGSRASSVLDATGYITARRIATVSAKITGKVEDVLIEEGQHVEEGQVLARLEVTDAQAQRALGASQLAAAQSQVAQVRAQLQLAEKTLARSRELAERRLVPQQQLDQAQSEHDALRAAVASAQRQVDVARDALAVADSGIDNTIVRAPFAGSVTAKAAQPGEIVSPISAGGGFTRTGIGTIVDMDSLEIQVDVNEAFIGRVSAGQPVEAVLNAYPDWRIPAEVIAIIPTADRSRATVRVRVALKLKDPRIVPDMGVRVSFLDSDDDASDSAASEAAPGVLVPAEALVSRDGRDLVFVLQDGRARSTQVQVGERRGANARIASGLAIVERVILSPPDTLYVGDAVNVEP